MDCFEHLSRGLPIPDFHKCLVLGNVEPARGALSSVG